MEVRGGGQHVGTLGDAGSFSFQASKLMTAGEGGIVITQHADIGEMLDSYVNCGRDPGTWYYRHFSIGRKLANDGMARSSAAPPT